jgi:hypothetical protein
VTVRSFDILDRARLIFTHSVYVTFALAEGSASYKAFPAAVVAVHLFLQALQEAPLELQDLLDVYAHDHRT